MEHQFKHPIAVHIECPECHRNTSVTVEQDDFKKWDQVRHSPAEFFPYLTPEQCELFITGLCPDCWNKLFPDDGEDDE